MKSLNGTHILLVEDNEDHILITEKMLKRINSNCDIKVLKNVKSAVSYMDEITEQLPDFVLLDLDFPDGSGIDILKAYRSNQFWANAPVWILTTWGEEKSIAEAIDLGINGYLEKPLGKNGFEPIRKLFEDQYEKEIAVGTY